MCPEALESLGFRALNFYARVLYTYNNNNNIYIYIYIYNNMMMETRESLAIKV